METLLIYYAQVISLSLDLEDESLRGLAVLG